MALTVQAEALLADIRSALSITWVDTETDKQLKGIIERGMARLNDIAGTEIDYAEEGAGKALLINYCVYARSHALDQFFTNYLTELAAFQLHEEVKRYLAEKDGDTGLP